MSERIRVSHIDQSVPTWMVAREIFSLNHVAHLIEDVIPVENREAFETGAAFDVQVVEGTRAIVIGKLGEIAAIAVSESS